MPEKCMQVELKSVQLQQPTSSKMQPIHEYSLWQFAQTFIGVIEKKALRLCLRFFHDWLSLFHYQFFNYRTPWNLLRVGNPIKIPSVSVPEMKVRSLFASFTLDSTRSKKMTKRKEASSTEKKFST